MKAIVTSIGETTTDLCIWSLERNGFTTQLVYNEGSSLGDKLEYIYTKVDEDFLRVDADVVANHNCTPQNIKKIADNSPSVYWIQFGCYDWYKQDVIDGGVQYIKKIALTDLRNNIKRHKDDERPETAMYRLDSFMTPRRCITYNKIMGLHGFRQKDIDRIKATKTRRNQTDYDFELAEKLEGLCE